MLGRRACRFQRLAAVFTGAAIYIKNISAEPARRFFKTRQWISFLPVESLAYKGAYNLQARLRDRRRAFSGLVGFFEHPRLALGFLLGKPRPPRKLALHDLRDDADQQAAHGTPSRRPTTAETRRA